MHPTCAHAPMFAHVPHVCLYYMRNITQLGENLLDVRCADHYSTANTSETKVVIMDEVPRS